MSIQFFLVSRAGYILPYAYNSYEAAAANCDRGEMVFLAESLEELEYSLNLRNIEI